MLSYEFCKKLKDAGFPQGQAPLLNESGEMNYKTEDAAYLPSLSELIEACGECFVGKGDDGWAAGGGTRKKDDKNNYLYGARGDEKTPEEAVANLWLAINKKEENIIT